MRPYERSPSLSTRPAACPFCQSTAVGTLAKIIDPTTYWRCSRCGSGWTAPRPWEQAVRGTR
jgi:transposase-like protein